MKFKVWVSTGLVGSKRETIVEIPDNDIEGLTARARNYIIEEDCKEAMFEMIEWNFEEVL